MASTPSNLPCPTESAGVVLEGPKGSGDSGPTRLLLEAFESFTQASSSLELAFQQLQMRARRLSDELEAKNRQLKKSLREKEEVQNYLRRILESLPCGVLVLNQSGNVMLCNPLAAKILNEPQTTSAKVRQRRHPLQNAAMRGYFSCSASETKGSHEIEIPVIHGGRMRVLATSGTPLKSASGATIGTLHIIRDITEVKLLEEQSKRGERLAAMGEMAVELAHEIRNPLGSIELFASLLEKELSNGSDMRRWAENIRIGSRSLNNIVSNMLHFANPLPPKFTEVDVHEVVEEILSFTAPIMKQRQVRVGKALEAGKVVVCGDRELLKQMMLNLVLNAMQAMPSTGSLRVATRNIGALPGGALCEGLEIRVQDTGLGIPPENLARIFDPFFTTNRNGTGLGLSVVHQIVEKHSGFIQVESEVSVGTTFTITFPCARLILGAAQGQ